MREPFTVGQISLAAILLMLGSAFAAHLLSKSRSQDEHSHNARKRFRGAFSPVRDALCDMNTPTRDILLDEDIIKFEKEVLEYSRYLSFFKRRRLTMLWSALIRHPDDNERIGKTFVHHYDFGSLTIRERVREFLIETIDAMLRLAEVK